jgi:hypothetical protein
MARAPLRGLLIDPWRRVVEPIGVPIFARECGCIDADGRFLAERLGRRQWAHPILGGAETLIAGALPGPRWMWGDIVVHGRAIILGGTWAHAFSDSQMLVNDVEACISWPRRGATARAA